MACYGDSFTFYFYMIINRLKRTFSTHHIWECNLILGNNQSYIKRCLDVWLVPTRETTSSICRFKLSDASVLFLPVWTARRQGKMMNNWLTMFESATNELESSITVIPNVAFTDGSSQHGNTRRACVLHSCVTAEYDVTASFSSPDNLYPNHQ
jgi:hypothetical protein